MSTVRTTAEGLPIYSTPGGGELPHADDGAGAYRALGLQPAKPDFGGLPRFSASHKVIPRGQWKPISFAGYDVPIMDQGRHGSCVGHGAAGAFWKSWLISGATPHEFSPCFVYGLGNGGRDAGMVISDALDILTNTGICLASEVPEGMIWKQQFPASAMTTARRFRVAKAYHAGSFDEIATGLQMGFIPVYGIYVGNDFGSLDREGVAPAYRWTANHCMYGDELVKLPSGRWAIRDNNSWTERFGNGGRCYLTEQHFGRDCDAFLIQAVCEDPQETNLPPVAQ